MPGLWVINRDCPKRKRKSQRFLSACLKTKCCRGINNCIHIYIYIGGFANIFTDNSNNQSEACMPFLSLNIWAAANGSWRVSVRLKCSCQFKSLSWCQSVCLYYTHIKAHSRFRNKYVVTLRAVGSCDWSNL